MVIILTIKGGQQLIVSYLPVEALNQLVAATGFNLEGTDWEYKYTWLLERIGMLKQQADMANIVHDNQTTDKLVALVEHERRWSAGLQNTIAAYQVELEDLRRKCGKN